MILNKFLIKDSYRCIRCDVYSSHLLNFNHTIEYLDVGHIYLKYHSNDRLITINTDTNGYQLPPAQGWRFLASAFVGAR